jgi:thioredoxin 1
MAEIIDIQHKDWETEVVKEERPVLVEYWHNKCPSCILMEPIIVKLHKRMGDKIKIARLNLLENKENRRFAITGGIRSTPTFVIYCNGEPTGQLIGAMEEHDFFEALDILIDMSEKCVKGTPLDEE